MPTVFWYFIAVAGVCLLIITPHLFRRFPNFGASLSVAAIILGVFALAGCGPEEGTVLSRQYVPDRSYYTTVADYATTCSGTGTSRTCTSRWVGSHQQWHYVPECWELKIEEPGGDTGHVCVDRTVYDASAPGTYWRKAS